MKKLTIYGKYNEDGFSYRMMSGDPSSTDAFNTMMQVLRGVVSTPTPVTNNTFDYTFPITL